MDSKAETYKRGYDAGLPFVKKISFPKFLGAIGGDVVLGTTTYTLGTDATALPSDTTKLTALYYALAEAVNGYHKTVDYHNQRIGNVAAYARSTDEGVFFFGRVPGDDFILTSTVPGVVIDGGVVTGNLCGSGAIGCTDDAPQAIPATIADASAIALLKGIYNNTDGLELSVDNIDLSNAQIVVNTQEIEDKIGALTSVKETDPDAASANTNQLMRGILEAVNEVSTTALGFTDGSGTLTLLNTEQDALAANAARRYLIVQNVDPTNVLWVDIDNDAVEDQPSFLLQPKGLGILVFEDGFIPTGRVSVIGGATGQKFVVKEG